MPGLRLFALSAYLLTLSATSQAAEAVTYKDVAPILTDACNSCHASDVAYGNVVLDSEDLLLKNKDAVLEAVSSGSMPLGQPEFKDSPEGQKLLNYLKANP